MKIKYCGKKKRDITVLANQQTGLKNPVTFKLAEDHVAEVEDNDARALLRDTTFQAVPFEGAVWVPEAAQNTTSGIITDPYSKPAPAPIPDDSAGIEGTDPDTPVKTRKELVNEYVASLGKLEKIDMLAFINSDPLFNDFKADTRQGKEKLLGNIHAYMMDKKELGV
jgi:hypothetical protein